MLIDVYKKIIIDCDEAINSTDECKEEVIDILSRTYQEIIDKSNLSYYNQDNRWFELNLNKDLKLIKAQFEREIGLLEEKGKYTKLETEKTNEVANQNIIHVALNNQNINMISVNLDVVETTINDLSNEYLSKSEKDEVIRMVNELYEQNKGKDNRLFKQKYHELANYICDKSVDAFIALAPVLLSLVL